MICHLTQLCTSQCPCPSRHCTAQALYEILHGLQKNMQTQDAARGSVHSTRKVLRQRETYLRSQDAVLQDLEQEPRWRLEQYHLPSLSSFQPRLRPSPRLDPTGFRRESSRPEGSRSVQNRAMELCCSARPRDLHDCTSFAALATGRGLE